MVKMLKMVAMLHATAGSQIRCCKDQLRRLVLAVRYHLAAKDAGDVGCGRISLGMSFKWFDIWRFPKSWGTPIAGWFIVGNPIKMDDLELPLFQETSIHTISKHF